MNIQMHLNQYKYFYENVMIGVVSVDKRGVIQDANRISQTILGLTHEEIIGKHIICSHWKMFDEKGKVIPENQHPVNLALQSSEEVGPITIRVNCLENQRSLWLSVTSTPYYDASGTMEGVFSTFDDITSSKKLSIEYKMLFEQMLDGFALHEMVYDQAGKAMDYRFLIVNPAFRKITGIESLEIEGKTVLNVFPETENYWIETYGTVAKTGNPVWFEHYSGALNKTFEVRAFSPEPGKFATLFSDVSKRLESERVLTEAKKIVERENDSKSRFLANISHEIRTPINSILGAMTLLDLTRLSEEQSNYVELGRRSAEILLSLVEGILDLSKTDSCSMEIEWQSIHLKEIILDSWLLLSIRATEKAIQFTLDMDDASTAPILGDYKKITQILLNLFGNAVKFTSNGCVKVSVYSKRVENGEDNWINIKISDTGIGMSETFMERIFTPFAQEKSSNGSEGVGLGLSITKNLVEMLGGHIRVESQLGVGSTFTVLLPLKSMSPEGKWIKS